MRLRNKPIFLISIYAILVCCTGMLYAQLPIYNSDFKLLPGVQTKGELGQALHVMGIVDRTYTVQGASVIEYYEMNSARFLGFAGDTSLFDLAKLPYLSRTPMMKRLVRQFGPQTAHDIRQGKFVPGMLQKDVLAIHSWPNKRRREKGKTIWTYDEVVLEFERKELTRFMKEGS
jgi:hypothetical protein